MSIPHITTITNLAEFAGKQRVSYPPSIAIAFKIVPEFRIGLGDKEVVNGGMIR